MGDIPLPETLTRQTRLKLSLGTEQLRLRKLEASEAISESFRIELDVLSTLGEIDLLPHLGTAASVLALLEEEPLRHFHGIVTEGQFIDEIPGVGLHYRLVLRPSTWFHERGRNFRIFQDKTVIDTVKHVLDGCHIDYEIKAQGGKRLRSYCVQYGESDFAFVCRLLEEDGLYYYYRHESRRHVMVICDAPASHQSLEPARFRYVPDASSIGNVSALDRAAGRLGFFVHGWHEIVATGAQAKVTMRDYDFTHPATVREAVHVEPSVHEGDKIEVYDWPGRYYVDADGRELSTVLLESLRAQRQRYEGRSQFTGFQVGYTMHLDEHPVERFNRGYLITACETSLADETYGSDMAAGESETQFTAIGDDVQFRPPQQTPRPVARGPETAMVVGPHGEEIYTDQYGRVKVHFHWDREGKRDAQDSCWLRVSQTGGLGNIIIPRIGHEVLVDFINGDPDRPIVVGRVFNQQHMPVYELPQHKTRAVWRTKTYLQDSGSALAGAKALDTGAPGANEIRFEDGQQKEELFVHAERDMNTRVRNNDTLAVGGDQTVDIGGNRTETVNKNETITIMKNRTETVQENETISITKNRSETVGQSESVTIGSSRELTVGSSESRTIGANSTETVGQQISITAGTKITLTCGASTITMTPTGIDIKTMMLTMNGQVSAKLSGLLTNVEAQALLTEKGALVMIN
ncbi:MAG: type VI secretion system tip protein VgrG [Novosphingobium sp.]|nr:type VI secretion system tip protein VgrG [Novosphingobium sp.]